MGGEFIACDIFELHELEHCYDLIICHDVFEHLDNKAVFLDKLRKYLKDGGVVFMSFPAWHMPFGGHQQICRGASSKIPWLHLLPNFMYIRTLEFLGETHGCIQELLDIKNTRATIEMFEKMAKNAGYTIKDRMLYFINPHYETKFGLKPRKLNKIISSIPFVRNFFTTSCFYILELQ